MGKIAEKAKGALALLRERLVAVCKKTGHFIARPFCRGAGWFAALSPLWKRTIVVSSALLVIAAATTTGLYIAGGLRTVPLDALNAVYTDSTFLADSGTVLLYTDGRVDLSYLRRNLKTVNKETFSVSKVTDRVFSVRFDQTPDNGSTILLQLQSPNGYAAAKQYTLTTAPKQATGSLQAKLICAGSVNQVEADEPILLLFSQSIPAEQLRKHLEFSSDVPTQVQMVNNVAIVRPQQMLQYKTRYSISVSSGLEVDGQILQRTFSSQFITAPAPGFYAEPLQNLDFGAPTAAPITPLTYEVLYGNSSSAAFDPKGSITLVFSDTVPQETLSRYLSVRPGPDLETVLECKENVAVLRFSRPLDFSTKYVISIGGGMESKNGHRLNDRQVIEVTTAASALTLSLTNQASNVVDPTKPLTLEFAMENRLADHQLIELTLYRMDNYQQYRTVLSVQKIQENYSLLELESSTHVLRNGLNKIQLENPGKGIYMVQATTTDPDSGLPLVFYKCLNVSDLSVYLQTANERTTVWVNSTVTSAAQSGLQVELTDRTTYALLASGVTEADGSCQLVYSSSVSAAARYRADGVLTIYDGQKQVIYTDTTHSISSDDASQEGSRFYTFFFTDRTLYHPTDTIHFWGFVKPYMLNTDPLPPTVRVFFDEGDVDAWVDVPLQADGAFTGQLAIDKVVSSQYSLQAYLYDAAKPAAEQLTHLNAVRVEAKEFEKPTFMLSMQPGKPLYAHPEQVEISAKLTFYDGTPVPNYPLELEVMSLDSNNIQEVKKVTTDASGTAVFRFRPQVDRTQSPPPGPVYGRYNVTLSSDGEIIRRIGQYQYQAVELVTDLQGQVSGTQQVDLTVKVNQTKSQGVTADALEALQQNLRSYYHYSNTAYRQALYQMLAGEPANVGVQGTAQVDYIDMLGNARSQSFPIGAVTKNGRLQQRFKLEVPYDPKYNVGVAVKVSCVDDKLNLVSSQWNHNTIPPAVQDEETEIPPVIKGYSLSVTANHAAQPLPVALNYMGYNDQLIKLGDSVTFRLCKDGLPVTNQGKLFYQLIQENPIDQQIITESSFTLQEIMDYGQSVHLVAAYFDGVDVHPVADTALRLDLQSTQLDIAVAADKEQYRPGETVSLAVQVKDRNGRPLEGNLCISVVDESVFALSEQYINVVGELYSQVGFGSVHVLKYTTATGDYVWSYTGGDGGKGDDGIEAYDVIRDKFKDTAHFYSTKTNQDGTAQLSFVLPDNITSWRITTVSVGGSLYGGSQKQNFVTTMPFFSKPVLTSKYLAGDEVVMLAQGHGTLLEPQSQIAYQIKLTGNGQERTLEATGQAYQPVPISFGKLEAGEYSVSTTAQLGNYRDTVVLPLTVIPSNLEMVVNRRADPQKLNQLNVSRYPVTLTFYDQEHESFYKTLSSLFTHFCNRADQRLSRYTAKQVLKACYPVDQIPRYILETGDYIADMQQRDGGISWYPATQSNSDLMLTVRVLLATGSEPFSAQRMAKYFQAAIDKTGTPAVERAAAYAGLAYLQPETVKEIDSILKGGELPMQARLYYLVGLAYGGDSQQALALYQRDVAPALKAIGDTKQLVYQNQPQEDRALTATAWVLASKLQLPDADAFARYFIQDSWGISHIFESMVYVRSYSKVVEAREPVRYTINGQPGQLSTGPTGQAARAFNKQEWEGLTFEALPQGISTLAYYVGEPSDVEMAPSADISITKAITPQEDGSYLNTITVQLADTALMGSYDISDWIPSNMRYFGMQDRMHAQVERELQKMYFSLYHDGKQNQYTISYITRKSFEAETMQDRTYIIHADSGNYSFAEREALRQ